MEKRCDDSLFKHARLAKLYVLSIREKPEKERNSTIICVDICDMEGFLRDYGSLTADEVKCIMACEERCISNEMKLVLLPNTDNSRPCIHGLE